MGIITGHWSATSPERLGDYHAEFGQRGDIPQALLATCRAAVRADQIPWSVLRQNFNVWKNTNFDTVMTYGTWDWNHDFRDGSPNIEVGALCMGGPHTGTTNFGQWPYTKAHAWMHAGVIARIAHLKGIKPLESFEAPAGYMNGPLYAISTHGERAYQTANPGIDDQGRGYGLWSKDPDCRWDLDVLDFADLAKLKTYDAAYAATKASASWLRNAVADILARNLQADMWGLDGTVAR